MMESMAAAFIQPMKEWSTLDSIGGFQEKKGSGSSGSVIFKDVFSNVVNQVTETQKDVEEKQYLLATGQLDDAHTLPIAEAKAALSVDVLISLRNKTMESYNELMKINV